MRRTPQGVRCQRPGKPSPPACKCQRGFFLPFSAWQARQPGQSLYGSAFWQERVHISGHGRRFLACLRFSAWRARRPGKYRTCTAVPSGMCGLRFQDTGGGFLHVCAFQRGRPGGPVSHCTAAHSGMCGLRFQDTGEMFSMSVLSSAAGPAARSATVRQRILAGTGAYFRTQAEVFCMSALSPRVIARGYKAGTLFCCHYYSDKTRRLFCVLNAP